MNSHLEFACDKKERLQTLREIVVDRIGFDLDLARFEPELKWFTGSGGNRRAAPHFTNLRRWWNDTPKQKPHPKT